MEHGRCRRSCGSDSRACTPQTSWHTSTRFAPVWVPEWPRLNQLRALASSPRGTAPRLGA
eukprot:5594100-Prymnesium_polylepis.1